MAECWPLTLLFLESIPANAASDAFSQDVAEYASGVHRAQLPRTVTSTASLVTVSGGPTRSPATGRLQVSTRCSYSHAGVRSMDTIDQMEYMVRRIVGKSLTYKRLTA